MSTDELDVFTDPRIGRATVIRASECPAVASGRGLAEERLARDARSVARPRGRARRRFPGRRERDVAVLDHGPVERDELVEERHRRRVPLECEEVRDRRADVRRRERADRPRDVVRCERAANERRRAPRSASSR